MQGKKCLLRGFIYLFACCLLVSCGKKSATDVPNKSNDNSKIVATYKGGQLTEKEWKKTATIMSFFNPEQAMNPNTAEFVKEQVAYKYLYENASAAAKKKGEQTAKEQFRLLKQYKEFTAELKKHKLTEEDVTNYVARIAAVSNHYHDQVTDKKLQAEFEKNKPDMTIASVRHILIGFTDKGKERKKEEALKQAKHIVTRLKKGEDFATLAKQLSTDPGSSKNGGLYKDVEVKNWVPQFKQAVLTLPLKQVSDPVETAFGYHVIRVEERKDEYNKLNHEDKKKLSQHIVLQQLAHFMQYDLNKLNIKIDLPKQTNPKEQKQEKSKGNSANKDVPTKSNK